MAFGTANAGLTFIQTSTVTAVGVDPITFAQFGGNVSITLVGDVTGSGMSPVSTTISNNAVTFAKIQPMSADTLLGNPTGVSANPQEVNLGSTLTFSGTTLQTTAMTGDVTTTANSFITAITNGAVDLTTKVSGVLPIANGGTNTGSQTSNGVNFYNGTITSNAILTYNGDNQLSLSTSNALATFILSSTAVGGSATYQVSRPDTGGSVGMGYYNAGVAQWFSGLWSGSNTFVFRDDVNNLVRMSIDQSGNVNISNLSASQLVTTDGSKNLTSLSSGSAGQVLTSNGAGLLPTWSTFGQYQVVAGTSQALSANSSYLATNAALTTFSLPTSNCPAGSCIKIAGSGSGLFTITQGSGQRISMGTTATTPGTGGQLSALDPNAAIELVCTSSNVTFMVVSPEGNFNLV